MADLKIAKPTNDDFEIVYRFNSVMEQLTDNRMFRASSLSDWEDWDKDDKDYQILKRFKTEVENEYDIMYDDEFRDEHYAMVLWKYIKWFFNQHPSSLGRIIMCANIAMDNAFDQNPEVTSIEWSPKLEEALELYDEKHKNKDENTDNR